MFKYIWTLIFEKIYSEPKSAKIWTEPNSQGSESNQMVLECPPLIKCKKVIDNKMNIIYNI